MSMLSPVSVSSNFTETNFHVPTSELCVPVLNVMRSLHPLQHASRDWDKYRCPLYPQKRTFVSAIDMSALCQKRTSGRLFDHLVGGDQQVGRYGQAEHLRGLQVDDQFE